LVNSALNLMHMAKIRRAAKVREKKPARKLVARNRA
jgi:hypothetical protein